MPKRNWRDHPIFDVFDLVYVLAGILEIIAYWHLGWRGVIGATTVIVIVLVATRLFRRRNRMPKSK